MRDHLVPTFARVSYQETIDKRAYRRGKRLMLNLRQVAVVWETAAGYAQVDLVDGKGIVIDMKYDDFVGIWREFNEQE